MLSIRCTEDPYTFHTHFTEEETESLRFSILSEAM